MPSYPIRSRKCFDIKVGDTIRLKRNPALKWLVVDLPRYDSPVFTLWQRDHRLHTTVEYDEIVLECASPIKNPSVSEMTITDAALFGIIEDFVKKHYGIQQSLRKIVSLSSTDVTLYFHPTETEEEY
ncbi:hypothetical protein [uncultured Cohaesibacter sp.]|uniref:hypothetical protein n=1 Tax=uncultured Cohaesibacter sp. TaxID=1002546 RepID=UPI0029C824F0|nr:hypothetical protein [uncultured Cohaesibacter sp.]